MGTFLHLETLSLLLGKVCLGYSQQSCFEEVMGKRWGLFISIRH